jgi:hypothetical protein
VVKPPTQVLRIWSPFSVGMSSTTAGSEISGRPPSCSIEAVHRCMAQPDLSPTRAFVRITIEAVASRKNPSRPLNRLPGYWRLDKRGQRRSWRTTTMHYSIIADVTPTRTTERTPSKRSLEARVVYACWDAGPDGWERHSSRMLGAYSEINRYQPDSEL